MRVLLIGAGRYGNSLVGRKYASGEFGVKLAGVVDPKIDEIKKATSYTLKGIPTYHTLNELPKNLVKDCVSDIAIIPQIVLETCKKLVNMGAKKIILPKPVITTKDEFDELTNLTESEKIKAVVASNWHYSNITTLVKVLLDKLSGKESNHSENIPIKFKELLDTVELGYKIDEVKIEYNKKDEVLTIDPPLQELPHAIQIVYSTGLTNLEKIKLVMNKFLQSKSRVNVNIIPNSHKENIYLNSDLLMGEKLNKRRERLLKIFLSKGDEKALITADYDAMFNSEGVCEKLPSIKFESTGERNINWTYEIFEDNMNVMYRKMLDYMNGVENNSLTIQKYRPIAEVLCDIESSWKKLTSNLS